MAEAAAQDTLQDILEEASAEQERLSAELREIGAKLEQSRGEIERLAKANAKVTGELKTLVADFESVPRTTIKEIYDTALETQQRLYTMRNQVDKLQADQANLMRYQGTLEQLLGVMAGVEAGGLQGLEGGDTPGKSTVIRVIEAQEVERQRLANQMHDGPAQSLTNFILQAEICQRLFDKDVNQAREELSNLKAAASGTFQKVRDFIFDLRPMMLDDLGLVPTVRRYVDAFGEKSGLAANLFVSGEERRLEPHREVILFRALQDLLARARDHANATEVSIVLDMGSEQIRASVEDNGRGFTTDELQLESSKDHLVGLGTLQERVELIGGEVHVDSASGEGSKVALSIPAGPAP